MTISESSISPRLEKAPLPALCLEGEEGRDNFGGVKKQWILEGSMEGWTFGGIKKQRIFYGGYFCKEHQTKDFERNWRF